MTKVTSEISEENRRLEEEIRGLAEALKENKKDLIYRVGLTIGENTHPRSHIVTIPGKLRKLRKSYREGTLAHQIGLTSMGEAQNKGETQDRDELAYNKELKERVRQLKFYNDKDHTDILFTIGDLVEGAGHSVVKWAKLPFQLFVLRKNNRRLMNMEVKKLPPIEGLKETILFIATNGAGLGHLTRCLAVARKLKRERPDTEIIFLTTSLALTSVHREGFTAYCIPSLMLIKNISAGQWNALLKTMMTQLLQLYRFSAVIFDGAMPYASITAAMAGENKIPRIWIRRGSEKSGEIADKRVQAEKEFDYVILPGEAGGELKAGDGKHINVNPIIYLDKEEIWTREQVRRFLKIPEGKKAVYVQLGAGNINDIDSDIYKIVTELRKYPDVLIVLGESMIGNELKIIEDDILIIKDYPNAKYFNGFDFAISACGYNSFHELLYFGVPTIFLPNRNTKTDDQYARAMISERAGAGIVVTDIGSDRVAEAIRTLCDEGENKKMRENAKGLIAGNGAGEAAKIICDILDRK